MFGLFGEERRTPRGPHHNKIRHRNHRRARAEADGSTLTEAEGEIAHKRANGTLGGYSTYVD
eukprot:scaffold35211_cov68-Phaeocystis_antarctica.AAC.4